MEFPNVMKTLPGYTSGNASDAPERIWAFNAKQTGYRFYANGPQPEFDNVEYVRADLAQAPTPVPVQVKKLVWHEKPEGQDCRIGRCDRIAYAVERHGKFWGFRRGGESGLVVAVGAGSAFSTEAEAMAGADRDHVKRILAALEAPDAGVAAELVEAIAAEARRYAGFYPQGSDGQNTFVMFAEWVEQRALAIINKQKEPRA